MESALCYVNHDDLTKLKTLLECIGLISGGAAGLLKLMKVDLAETQDLAEGKITRCITRVREYRPAPAQGALDIADNGSRG